MRVEGHNYLKKYFIFYFYKHLLLPRKFQNVSKEIMTKMIISISLGTKNTENRRKELTGLITQITSSLPPLS